jgi:hypothetical protein
MAKGKFTVKGVSEKHVGKKAKKGHGKHKAAKRMRK